MIREFHSATAEHRNSTSATNQASTDVRAFVAIRAEWQRIFHALTIPEYMDLWLIMPGIERLECRPELRSPSDFRIDMLRGSSLRTIYGSWLRTRPDEITYFWDSTRTVGTARSVVKMRLRSGPKRCSLHLHHLDLRNQKECELYSSMWQESLDKLGAVMERRSTRIICSAFIERSPSVQFSRLR